MSAKALIVLADGFEDVEAVAAIDVLRRGGVEVVTASLSGEPKVRSAHGVAMLADASFADVSGEAFDAIVLPGGGEGTQNLISSQALLERLRRQKDDGGLLCAICAAPTVLAKQGYLKGRKAACYPGLENVLEENGAEPVTDEEVVKDGRFITSRGVGTAIPFALKLIKVLAGEDRAREIGRSIVYKAE